MRRNAFAAAVLAGAALSLTGSALADVRITDQAYVRPNAGGLNQNIFGLVLG